MLTSLKAAAVVAVLALTTSLLALQAGSSDEPGSSNAVTPGDPPVTVTGTEVTVLSGEADIMRATNTMSDPRLSGDVEITYGVASQYLADGNNDALFGTITIANEGGTWQGQWVGYADDQGRHHTMAWFDGTGDYEGLRYVGQADQRESNGVLDLSGLIYEGMAPGTVIPPEVVE